MKVFNGRLGLQQRVLPAYRAPFFDILATACQGGMSVFAGKPRLNETIKLTNQLEMAQYSPARNLHLFNGSLYLCYQRGIIDWLEDWQPDALIMEANPRYLSTHPAIRWMHKRGRPVIGWGLGAPATRSPIGFIRRRARGNFIHQFDGVIAYSRRGATEYRNLGVPADRIFVANNAATARPTEPPPERPPIFDGKPTIIFVGRLQTRKRIDNLLRACAKLPEDIQPRALIVGDGPAREDLERLAENIYPQAQFLGGRHGSELSELFAQSDLFVLPGSGGLAVQQAMAHGLPAIVAEGDGTQEDLIRPQNGWLIPAGDLMALSEALSSALSEPARLRSMGVESYRITVEEINLETMVATFSEALNMVTRGA